MQMKLIIESGATKTDFCLTGTGVMERFRTSGLNLATMDMDTVSFVVRDAVSHLEVLSSPGACGNVSEIHFYGAGLLEGEDAAKKFFRTVFPSADVSMESDLMAASRALWGHGGGITAILGTGSNSCVYDGCEIVKNVRPCGYVLGDFGSASTLGRMFLADYLQGLMPGRLADDFRMATGTDYASSVAEVYRGKAPARYLASLAPYILSAAGGLGHDGRSCGEEGRLYAAALVKDNFRTFIRRCLSQYDTGLYGTGVVGSFGYAARDFLLETALEEGVRITRMLKAPMDGLIEYHNEYVQ